MSTLSTAVSGPIVRHLSKSLGDERTREILDITPARLDAFGSERGRISDVQIRQIAEQTRKPWQVWAADAAEAMVRTDVEHALVAATRALCAPATLRGPTASAPKSIGTHRMAKPARSSSTRTAASRPRQPAA